MVTRLYVRDVGHVVLEMTERRASALVDIHDVPRDMQTLYSWTVTDGSGNSIA